MDRLHSMRVFCRVIDCQGFAAAARDLNLSPSVVTRQIGELETHLGVRLINRTTRRLVLTEAGERYLEQVRRILHEIDEAESSARSAAAALQGHLKVLAPPAFSAHQLAGTLVGFRQRYPGITVALSAPGIIETLDESFDVSVISAGEAGLQGDFIARKLATSKVIVCASPGYVAARGHVQTPRDLQTHELMVPTFSGELILRPDDPAAAANPVPVPVPTTPGVLPLVTNHMDTAYAACLAGLGLALLPSYVAAEALHSGRLLRMAPGWHAMVVTLYAAMPSRKHVPAKTRAFLDYLIETFGGCDEDPWLSGRCPSKGLG